MVSIADGLRAEGKKIGWEIGYHQGIGEGRERVAIARRLLALGVDMKIISDATCLEMSIIHELKQQQLS